MRKLSWYLSFLILITIYSSTCKKEKETIISNSIEDGSVSVSYDTVSFLPHDRNDISTLPDEQWWTLDTTQLDTCQATLWDYLKTMYPDKKENYWDYNIYSIMNEPADELENRAFKMEYMNFFIDSIFAGRMQEEINTCADVDSTFFLQALGEPTCKSYHRYTKEVNYFYYFKMRFRRGPCAYIFDEGQDFEYKCHPQHFDHCALMMMHFSGETGKMNYISFYGG